MSQKTFVLVHGAWHGAWSYERVTQRLLAKGYRVYVPTLTGLCERSHLYRPDINLTTHMLDVVNLIRWLDLREITLVGHSYGGMVVTAVADQMSDRIASLVYLDAFLPRDNQCLHDLVPEEMAQAKRAIEHLIRAGKTCCRPRNLTPCRRVGTHATRSRRYWS